MRDESRVARSRALRCAQALSAGLLLTAAGPAESATILVDPGLLPDGAIATNAFEGVELTVLSASGGDTRIKDLGDAHVLGRKSGTSTVPFGVLGLPFGFTYSYLRIEVDEPVASIALAWRADPGDHAAVHRIRAYSAAGTPLAEDTQAFEDASDPTGTLEITALPPGVDYIAFEMNAIASGSYEEGAWVEWIEITTVPEPSPIALFAAGILGLGAWCRGRRAMGAEP